MDIQELSLESIIPYENNPRLNDQAVEPVANSIKEFGFKVPIVVDSNNVIITGHTRLKAAQMLGMKTAPCIVANDLTDEQVKAFRLADNKVSELALWDMTALNIELQDIDMDMTDFGFYEMPDIDIDGFFEDAEQKAEDEIEEEEEIQCPHCHMYFKVE